MNLSQTNLDARITMLEQQRNTALTQVVVQAGVIADLQAEVAQLKAQLEVPADAAATT